MKKISILFAAICMLFVASQRMMAEDMTLRFYIPAAHGFATESGCAIQWYYEGSEETQLALLTADENASNWYQVAIPRDEENYRQTYLTLLNAPTAEAATLTLTSEYALGPYYSVFYYLVGKRQNGEFFLYAASDSWYAQYPNDYLAYNLQTSENEDTLFVSWESNSSPSSWRIYVYNAEGAEVGSNYLYDQNGYVLLSNNEPMEVTWKVYPNVYYESQEAFSAYSAPFTKSASPKVATNLQAVENADGTYTFSWDAALSPMVKQYQLNIQDPSGSWVMSEYDIKGTSITRSFQALFSGKYTMHVVSMDERGWNSLGEAVDTFEIAPVAAHDITVRILINPMSGLDTSEGVQFDVEKTAGNTETVDATAEQYGWYSYTFNTTERGARVGVKEGYWSSRQTIYGDTCIEYTGNYMAVECDARANDYQPHDILATPNADGTYTISWLMDRTERVDYYSVYIYGPTGNNVYGEDNIHTAQIKTGVLGDAGIYRIQLNVYETVRTPEGWTNTYRIGQANAAFEVQPQVGRDITVRVLAQPGSEGWYGFVYNEEEYDYTTLVPFAQEGESRWYAYTFEGVTAPAITVRFIKESESYYWGNGTTLSFSENTCVELDRDFKVADCSTAVQDFTLTNLLCETLENGQFKFSWECTSDPENFYIILKDAEGTPFKSYSTGGSLRYMTANVLVDSTMAVVNWSVYPAKNSPMTQYEAAGNAFSLTASPYVPRNIVATPNGDGRWTVTWDALPEPVTSYSVYNDRLGYTTWTNDARYVSDVMSETGYVTITITPQMSNGETGVSKSIVIEITEVEARDITVRLLIHPDARNTTAQDLYYYDNNYNTTYISPVDEGNGWYSYTFNSTKPAQEVYIMGDRYAVGRDTCFEYSSYLTYAACDAEAHDYRIVEGSLNAVSTPGKVVFSWSAVEKSANYYFTIESYNEEGGYWRSIAYQNVKDTCYTYMVPDAYDNKEVRWSVYPQEPHYLYHNQLYGENIVLHKSEIIISNMQYTSADSVSYHFSWDCNTDTVQYEVQISQNFYGVPLYSAIQSGKTLNYTFLSGASAYVGRIRAVNAAGEPLTNWVQSDYFNVRSSLRAISNLQGFASGRTITFTWNKTTPFVSAYVEHLPSYYPIVSDSIIAGNTLVLNNVEDGRYVLRLLPVIENAAGERAYITEEPTVAVNVFTEQTYAVNISTTTGGIMMEEYSGNYPIGYVIYPRIRPDEGYEFVGWSDGSTDMWRSIVVEGELTLIALFEKMPEYDVVFSATEGGMIKVDYREPAVSRFDTAVYKNYYFNLEAIPAEGYGLFAWSDGMNRNDLNRGIDIWQDTTIQAVFRPYCSVTVNANEGGRVQVSGEGYERSGKTYTCMAGTELTLKADPDEGYRFVSWSDGDPNVIRTYTVNSTLTLTASFESVSEPLATYMVRVLSSDPELGTVSQVSGTYTAGSRLTISAIPTERAQFVQWSDGNTQATRVITVNADLSLTATFAVKTFTLNISAGVGGSVNSEVNGIYEYGASVDITAEPNEGYHFVQWSDGYPYSSRSIEMTKDVTLTATFAQEMYLVTFLNADGSFIEANRYLVGEMPACSVTPAMEPDNQWIYTFSGWDPAIVAVTGNAIYTAVYDKTPKETGIDEIRTDADVKATKVLINGQIFILRGDRIYTIQGQIVK